MKPRPEGGPPVQDYRNQNARILDDVRVRTGIPLGQQYGMFTNPTLQPVFVVNPDAAPLPAMFGDVPAVVAAAVGFRSELRIAINVNDRALIAEVFITIINTAATAAFYEILGDIATIAGFGALTKPSNDRRYGLGDPGLQVASKNTAAASAGGTTFGNLLAVPAAGTSPRLGPFYLDGSQASSPPSVAGRTQLLVRPNIDNAGINALVSWRHLQRQPT